MTDHPLIRADFVKPQPVPSRKVLQLVFEVPEEQADHAMAVLGGYPQSGENRWCAIAQLAEGIPSETGVTAEQIGAEAIAQLKAEQPSEAAPESVKGMPTEADESATISNSSLRGGGGMAVGYHHPQPDGAEEQPSETTTERVKSTDDWSDAKRRMVQQSGIVRKEPAFHDFIARLWPVVWTHPRHDGKTDEEKATYFLHTSCGVESCRDLEPDEPSGQKFQDLMWRYGHAENQQRQREEGRT